MLPGLSSPCFRCLNQQVFNTCNERVCTCTCIRLLKCGGRGDFHLLFQYVVGVCVLVGTALEFLHSCFLAMHLTWYLFVQFSYWIMCLLWPACLLGHHVLLYDSIQSNLDPTSVDISVVLFICKSDSCAPKLSDSFAWVWGTLAFSLFLNFVKLTKCLEMGH